MPGAHRDGDERFCTGKTIVSGQTNVYVEGKLWAVDGDIEHHGGAPLKAVYGDNNVYINGKKVIVAIGDIAQPENDGQFHPPPGTAPKQRSSKVFVYGGTGGGS